MLSYGVMNVMNHITAPLDSRISSTRQKPVLPLPSIHFFKDGKDCPNFHYVEINEYWD